MKKSVLVNNIIFMLFGFLCILIMFVSYRSILYNKFPDIKISPYTGEISKQKKQLQNAIEVIFNLKEQKSSMDGLNGANIIIEYINSNNDPIYKAIYYDNKPKYVSPNSNICIENNLHIPKFNFIDLPDIPDKYIKEVNHIFISFNDSYSSNFIYKDGQYCHYKSSKEDLDKCVNKPISVSNVIVQFKEDTNGPKASGIGLLFCGGKVMDIKWNKEGDAPIKITDENGEPLSLIRGNTWWVILDKHGSIAYNP